MQNMQLSKHSMTRVTDAQTELLERVGLKKLLASDIVKRANIQHAAWVTSKKLPANFIFWRSFSMLRFLGGKLGFKCIFLSVSA